MIHMKLQKEREKAKAWDCEVSIPFLATTKDEAAEQAKKHMP